MSFLDRLVRLVLPDLARLAPCLDLRLLGNRVALARRGHQAGINDLTAHGEIAARLELTFEFLEHLLDRARAREPLTIQPDRVLVRRAIAQPEALEAKPAQTVADEELHALIADVVLRR